MRVRLRRVNLADPLTAAAASLQNGQPAESLRLIAPVLARQPDHPAALGIKANASMLTGEFGQAVGALQRLVELQPAQPALRRILSQALNRLGSAARQAHREDEAERAFRQAIEHWPDNRDALFNLALGYMQSRRHAQALPLWQRLRVLAPDDVEVGIELAVALALCGEPAAARAQLDQLALPDNADTALRLRHVQAMILGGNSATAARLADRLPDTGGSERAASLAHLAEQFAHAGETVAARSLYQRAAALRNNDAGIPGLRDLIASQLTIPAIVGDAAAIAPIRERFLDGVAALQQQLDAATLDRCTPGLAQLTWSNFFLAYHGENDRELQSAYGDLLARLTSRLAPALPPPAPARSRAAGTRIGLVSSCFRECTAGAYFGRWPRLLADAGYQVHVFQLGPHFDASTESIGQAPASLHRIDGDANDLARAVAAAQCDLLIYPELGMDARLLPVAALRLAPRQACAWGHPVSSGLPTIDGCFSCAAMEPDDAASHYRERLLLLPGLGTDYRQPPLPAALPRSALGLPENANLYLLPHSLFKLHPDNDAMFAAIAAADAQAVLVLFEGESAPMRPPFRRRLAAALHDAGADPERQMVFLPMGSRERFLQINQACDVMVDSLHWSGGNTSLDALICGLPVVTCPGASMRARQSMAMLRRLDLEELIVATPQALAALAVAIAGDRPRRQALSQRIRAGLPALFDSRGVGEALDRHVRSLLEGTQS